MTKYNWKITLWKGIKELIYVILTGLAVLYGNNSIYLVLLPIIKMLENWLKNHKR